MPLPTIYTDFTAILCIDIDNMCDTAYGACVLDAVQYNIIWRHHWHCMVGLFICKAMKII